jgi:hypothetical protein
MYRFSDRKIYRQLFISFFWILGLFVGFALSYDNREVITLLMRSVKFSRMSIVSLYAVQTFPFILSSIVFYVSKPLLHIPIVVFKSVFFGFLNCSIVLLYGNAGWLVSLLIMFSELVISCLWLSFLFQKFNRNNRHIGLGLPIYIFITLVIGIVDYTCVTPLVLRLLA